MNTIEIEQTIATGEAKVQASAYSSFVKSRYGLANYCGAPISCLVLLLWAVGAWDNRPGATNAYPETGLKTIITKINNI